MEGLLGARHVTLPLLLTLAHASPHASSAAFTRARQDPKVELHLPVCDKRLCPALAKQYPGTFPSFSLFAFRHHAGASQSACLLRQASSEEEYLLGGSRNIFFGSFIPIEDLRRPPKMFSSGFLLLFSSLVTAISLPSSSSHSPCRFAPLYSQADILHNSTAFAEDVFYWEGQFHQNNVGYNTANAMTYDGTLLNPETGLANNSEKHPFSAASKESLQIMVYAHVIAGDSRAARFVYPQVPSDAAQWAVSIMSTKLQTYLEFNKTYPGFGGFLPWFLSNETKIQPTSDWVNRVPALDNGELIWAVYAVVQALNQSKAVEWHQLAQGWQKWLDYTKENAARIFYLGDGKVCAVADLNQTVSPTSPHQNYTCEGQQTSLLNDPYEGELFTWWLYFFGGLSDLDKEVLWYFKRPQLVARNYTGSIVNTSYSDPIATNYSGAPVISKKIGPITVQEGFWFSSHESWKVLEMPYFDVPIVKRVFHNAERVRTCNSVLMGKNAGMFASVNNITDPQSGQIDGYISYAGIPSVANQTEQELDVITPYSVFPTILFNQSVGLAWYKNMLDAKGMQNPYGSSESCSRDGEGISAFVSWDSKITTVNALLGGVSGLVKTKMKKEGLYKTFIAITEREYGRVFGDKTAGRLYGEEVELCLPDYQVPVVNVTDFTMCS